MGKQEVVPFVEEKKAVQVSAERTLENILFPLSMGKKIYCLGLIRGMEPADARRVAFSYGAMIDTFLLEPGFQEMCENFKVNRWPDAAEADELWDKIRSRHFVDRLFNDAETQLDEKEHEKRDKTVVRVAAMYAMAVLQKKKMAMLEEKPVGDYDDIIIKRHREYVDRDRTDKKAG